MARYFAATSGNYGTSSTWDTVANTPTLSTSDYTIDSTGKLSASWTAPNTTNAITGVAVYLSNKSVTGSPTTLTATVQANSAGYVDTAATKTITLANVNVGWIYFRFPTPLTYASTASNYYRIKLATDTGTVYVTLATIGIFCYMVTDDRHTVPTSDNVFIIGHNEQSPITVTLDGTRTAGTTAASSTTSRSITHAVIIGNGGGITQDTTANSQLTHTGPVIFDAGGDHTIGTTGSPFPSSYTATYIGAGSTQGSGVSWLAGSTYSLQGAQKSSTSLWKGTIASGVGTAASPLVLNEAVDWSVGDEILIAASSDDATNYSQTESRFIITKNSATSYVLSATSGGSEAALTYTHGVGTLVTNVQRNIIFKGSSTSVGQFWNFAAQSSSTGRDVDWVRFENIDATLFFGVAPTSFVDIGQNVSMDYCVAYYGTSGLFRLNANTTAQTHTGLIAYSSGSETAGANLATTGGFAVTSCQAKTLADCICMGKGGNGFALLSSFSNILENCTAIACNATNNASSGGGIVSASSGQNAFNGCEVNACRTRGASLATALGETFINCLFGTNGYNQTADVSTTSTTYNDVLFDSCTFDSSNLITNYLNQTLGSEVRFNRKNDTDNVHEWYNVYGSATSEQSVIRSPGLSVRMRPENLATGFSWQFQVPVVQNSIAGFRGYFLKNATLGTSVVTISMYLPGNPVSSGSPDATTTLDNTTGAAFGASTEQSVNLSATYTGDIPGAAEIVINVKSNTAGAYLYADDFFNAGDRTTTFDSITGLNLWVGGKPLSVISPSVPSADDTAAAVWAYLQALATTPASMGTLLKDAADNAELAAIKP